MSDRQLVMGILNESISLREVMKEKKFTNKQQVYPFALRYLKKLYKRGKIII